MHPYLPNCPFSHPSHLFSLLPYERGNASPKTEKKTLFSLSDSRAPSSEIQKKAELFLLTYCNMSSSYTQKPNANLGILLSPLHQLRSQYQTQLPPCLQVLLIHSKNVLKRLCCFHRQEDLWSKNPLKALPALLNSSNMLACREGLVPACVHPLTQFKEDSEKKKLDVEFGITVPDSPVEGLRKLMVGIFSTQFKWILRLGIKRYPGLGRTVLWTATKTQHCKARLLSAVGMKGSSVMNKLYSVEESSEKVADLGAAVMVSVAGYYGLKLEVSKLIERAEKGVNETEQPPPPPPQPQPEILMLLKALEEVALSRALREYLKKKKKKAVKTEESGITPPPPPPRLLPTWLNRVGAGGKSSLQREEERMLKYQRSLFPRRKLLSVERNPLSDRCPRLLEFLTKGKTIHSFRPVTEHGAVPIFVTVALLAEKDPSHSLLLTRFLSLSVLFDRGGRFINFSDLVRPGSSTDEKVHPSLVPALPSIIGNIVTGDDAQTQHPATRQTKAPFRMLVCRFSHDALLSLLSLLTHNHNKSIKKEACWTISIITAGKRTRLLYVKLGLICRLVSLLTRSTLLIFKDYHGGSRRIERGSRDIYHLVVMMQPQSPGGFKPITLILLSHCTFCVCGIKSRKKRQAALGIRQEEDHKIKNNKINNNLARRFTECLEQDQDRSVRILTVAVEKLKEMVESEAPMKGRQNLLCLIQELEILKPNA
ncbi:hypothetical protein F2Q69_00056742 [Brassica cretica]|uniref:Uncharacterized protein n=1 Tax=Brassica cretica TaxID=69181 RepID=A0A8S9MR65_BRACR|nr:hypothetical protein F2Q69_00056742 [Brassica cretica]